MTYTFERMYARAIDDLKPLIPLEDPNAFADFVVRVCAKSTFSSTASRGYSAGMVALTFGVYLGG